MTFERMKVSENQFSNWLFLSALPLWNDRGIDRHAGGFHEAIDMEGMIPDCPRRARVQGRQSFVFALAGKLGWNGPWDSAAEDGLKYLDRCYRSDSGLYHTRVLADGTVFDSSVMTYDQAFILLAAAQLYEMRPNREDLKFFARLLMRQICLLRRCPEGGFWEAGAKKYLSNPQMHLLEAALFWAPLDQDPIWMEVASEIVSLALDRFIDPKRNALFEEFEENWVVSKDVKTLSVEPGHQFEWAWLLEKWAVLTDRNDAHNAAETLFVAGRLGVDAVRNVAIDEVDHEFKPRRNTARLWPQTERLKAAVILYEGAEGDAVSKYETEIVSAAQSLWRYLEVPLKGLWRDKMLPDGSFVDEAAPASSFYHIIMGIDALASAIKSGSKRHRIIGI